MLATQSILRTSRGFVAGAVLLALAQAGSAGVPPLCLHPDNPHYFLFRGDPTLIVTSGEHYGAVINLDFDYMKYLDTLGRDGLNGTRTWAGAYCEPSSAFNIAGNTLAPLPGRFICPWARSEQPGYANGGNKFDLARWDEAYFRRLKDFMGHASRRGVIVELNLFCPFYEDSMWRLSPMNTANNVNGVGAVARTDVYTLDKHGGLLAIQEAMVRKIVGEMKDFDNLYYEICNEPYFGGVTLAWQGHIAEVIADAEKGLGARHLISQNIANDKAKVDKPHPAVSIFNFHYATPPDTVAMNYGLNKPIGDNETGFRGTQDAVYRMEGWDFIIAGGALYNNLDYSFTAVHEDGSFVYPPSQPGGGSPSLRRQLRILVGFIGRFDILRMQPDNSILKNGLPRGATARALVKPGQEYAIYIRTAVRKEQDSQGGLGKFADGEILLNLALPAGTFIADWFDTQSGSVARTERFTQSGDVRTLAAPAFEDDIALAVRRSDADGTPHTNHPQAMN